MRIGRVETEWFDMADLVRSGLVRRCVVGRDVLRIGLAWQIRRGTIRKVKERHEAIGFGMADVEKKQQVVNNA